MPLWDVHPCWVPGWMMPLHWSCFWLGCREEQSLALRQQKNQKRGKEKNSASKDQWSKRREQGYRRSRLGRRMGGPVWEAVEGRGNGGKSKVSWRGGEQTGRHKHEVKPFLFLWEKLLLSWVTFFSQTTALLIYWWWWWCRLWKTEQSLFYFNLS